jgi:hypothetical protein
MSLPPWHSPQAFYMGKVLEAMRLGGGGAPARTPVVGPAAHMHTWHPTRARGNRHAHVATDTLTHIRLSKHIL